jgi:hypothetical protein
MIRFQVHYVQVYPILRAALRFPHSSRLSNGGQALVAQDRGVDDAMEVSGHLNTPARSGGPDNLNHRTLRLLLTAFVRHAGQPGRCFTT